MCLAQNIIFQWKSSKEIDANVEIKASSIKISCTYQYNRWLAILNVLDTIFGSYMTKFSNFDSMHCIIYEEATVWHDRNQYKTLKRKTMMQKRIRKISSHLVIT